VNPAILHACAGQAATAVLSRTNRLELALNASDTSHWVLNFIVLHSKPQRTWCFLGEVLICSLHQELNALGSKLVVAEVDLLYAFAVLEDVRQPPCTIIIDTITEKLENLELWASLTNVNKVWNTL